ncbi:FKBP-type peptidyl-prolyl cis-trans isomerase [Stieleria marina]|uniref:Peptidyl-prolyl cis-trans isomerase n=1 Tax=Stieleria marina TaxID=1930275 RepID=A0A517NPN5_9BACT|nr:FKBP-type 22 kDa peptidyl-prolyl cis-trans isomerase [Planctomycetes bacterium K23_9]
MSLRTIGVALAVVSLTISAGQAMGQDKKANKAAASENPMGYFLGVSVGQQMAQQGFKNGDFDVSSLAAGVADGLEKLEPALSAEELKKVQEDIEKLLRKRQEEMMAEQKKAGALNKEKGELWLKQNAKKEGVKEIEGGVQYKVLKAGKGGSPSESDTVRVHYTGTLTNGKEFDSSVKRGEPAEFRVGQVIKGWQMALQKMKVGDKWMLYIPSDLAYGERGSRGAIGPNEVLVFEVELLGIN